MSSLIEPLSSGAGLWVGLTLLVLLGLAVGAVVTWSWLDRRTTERAAAERSAAAAGNPAVRRRLREALANAEALDNEADQLRTELRRLQQQLGQQQRERDALIGRAASVARRDREELIRLQDEVEELRRIGAEKARLIRCALGPSEAERRGDRLQAALSALTGALDHAKRAHAVAEARAIALRDRLRTVERALAAVTTATGAAAAAAPRATTPAAAAAAAAAPAAAAAAPAAAAPAAAPIVSPATPAGAPAPHQPAAPDAAADEIPVEIPVGFTPLPSAGLRPTYSENRPSST